MCDTEYSTMSEALADNEEIYEDPGHKKEKIYAWFEKKKLRKLESDDIKYVAICIAEIYSYIYPSTFHIMFCIEFYRYLDLGNSEWLTLAYGLMVLLILYK